MAIKTNIADGPLCGFTTLFPDHNARGIGRAGTRVRPQGEADELLLHPDPMGQARLQQQLRPPLQALLQTGGRLAESK